MPVVAPVAVYRFFDVTGVLLYVGLTESPAKRWRSHAADKPWWPDVADAKIEWHVSAEAATAAERAAIRSERPRHNIALVIREAEPIDPQVERDALGAVSDWARMEHAASDALTDVEAGLDESILRALAAGIELEEIVVAARPSYIVDSEHVKNLGKRRRAKSPEPHDAICLGAGSAISTID